MGVKALTWAFEQPVSATEKVVLLALADHANEECLCWPSIALLVHRANVGERTVQRAIQSLEDKGFISRERRQRDNGSDTSNLYRLNVTGQREGVNLTPHNSRGGVIQTGGEGVTGTGGEGVTGTVPRTIIKNRKKETSNISYDAEFEEFWRAYPKRPGNSKKDALKAYTKARKKLEVPHQDIMNGVKAYAAYREGEPPQYTKTASAWLNGWMWESDWTVPVKKSEPETPEATDADLDAIVGKYPGIVSDRNAAKRALATEMAKGITVEDIVKAAEKFRLYIKQMQQAGTMMAAPILETWIKFKWREMDAYYIYRNPVQRYGILKPVKDKK